MTEKKKVARGGRVQKFFTKPSRTRQEFKLECDINRILDRFQKTGVIDHLVKREPRFFDALGVPDFHEAQNLVVEARSLFAELPAKVRKRFSNDPGEFLEYMSDPANAEQARAWGLLPPLQTPEAAKPPEAPSGAPGGPQGAPDSPKGAGDLSAGKPPPAAS